MTTQRVEKIRAEEARVGDRIKAPDGRAFYELTAAHPKPGLEPGEDMVELGTGWGSVRLQPGEIVERENWQVGDAAAEVEGAVRGRLADLRTLLDCVNAEAQYSRDDLQGLGVEADPADDPETARDEATERLDEFPLCVESTRVFEIVIGTGGPDDRFLIECSGGDDGMGYDIDRVLYRYSWSGSAERVLSGDDRELIEAFARRVVPELVE